MLSYLKWTFWILFWGAVALFFWYTLPQYDIVRITDTYAQRVEVGDNAMFWAGADTGNATGVPARDVFFIQAFRPNGRPAIYRNEDTGWGWPPYFKFDTANLQAEAADSVSTEANPTWVAVRHYGWRNEFISIYPNAVALERVDGPDARKFSITSIAILVGFGLFVWFVWGRLRRWRRRRIDPFLDDSQESWDEAERRMKSWWPF